MSLTLESSLKLAAFAAVSYTTPLMASPDYTTSATIVVLNVREAKVDLYAPQADNPMNCQNAGWFRLYMSASNYNGILSFIMTRFSAQSAVRLYTASCDIDGVSIFTAASSPFQ